MNQEDWKDLISYAASGISYLDDVSREYEIDNPEYVKNLQDFKQKKRDEISDVYSQLVDITDRLDNYTSYVNNPEF